MKRSSPPKHRHDGTSPLPLGMDWSPPPKKWDGRNTVWPHDPHTGWSYCVMVPSWIIQTESKSSNDSLLNPIIFYRIQVGIQSPEGVSSIHGILHRFSDFLKLHSAVSLNSLVDDIKLKKAFPKKDIPAAPPKHALLRINTSRILLEQRRRALEEWIGKLLSDIDLSRSAPVAAFLELEVAARSSFRDTSQLSETAHLSEASQPQRSGSGSSLAGSSAVASKSHSVTSDIGSDSANETSDVGTSSRGIVPVSETGSDLSNGILLGESVLDQPEEFLRLNLQHRKETLMDHMPEQGLGKPLGHSRKLSADSIGSDVSSLRGSEASNLGVSNSIWDSSVDLTEVSNDAQIVLPLDQRHKLNRVLVTMQQRLVTAKTDMEDLIARLNQEMAVKEYLTTKVKDLEGELEVTKQKSKENLQQAILVERERVTQMQWDMDDLRRKYLEMESKLKIVQSEKTRVESEKASSSSEKELLLQELDSKQEQRDRLQKHLEDVEMKSKADIKVLVKEVKFLRSSQGELKEMLNQSMKDKTELEKIIQNEKQKWAHSKSARKKLLHECELLCSHLQECSVNFLAEEEDKFPISSSSLSDAFDLLTTSDNRIGLLLAEAQLLTQDDEHAFADTERSSSKSTDPSKFFITMNGDDPIKADEEMRKMLTNILIDNARLRKQVNSVIRCALKTVVEPEKWEGGGDEVSRKSVLNRLLER